MTKTKLIWMTLIYIFAGIGLMSFSYHVLEFADTGGFCKIQKSILMEPSTGESK